MGFYVKHYDHPLWCSAEKRANNMPVYSGSHRREAANQVGALGEVVFEHFLESKGIPFLPRYVTSEDLEIAGDSIEIKTKDRTVRPRPDYECSVPLYNHQHQRPNSYAFVSLLRDRSYPPRDIRRFRSAFLLGWCTLEDLERLGVLRRTGETDPSNGTTFWTSCLNLYIWSLRPMMELVSHYTSLTAASPLAPRR